MLFVYDVMNRLISVTDYDGTVITSNGVTTNIAYVNDYTQEAVEVLTKTTGTSVENYYYGNDRISSDDTIYVYDVLFKMST